MISLKTCYYGGHILRIEGMVCMLRIAICDDDRKVIINISDMLSRFFAARNIELILSTFFQGVALAEATERGERFDIIFLDVLMPGINGIETAEEIRQYDENVKIIFLTSSAEFAVDSYAVRAWYYMLKPIREDSFFDIIGKAFVEIATRQEDSLILSIRGRLTRILLSELVYCEIINKTLFYHLMSGKVLEIAGNMVELEQKLLHYPFFEKTHRSYIVNLRYIETFTIKEITMTTKEVLPLARGRFEDIRRAYLSLPFEGD